MAKNGTAFEKVTRNMVENLTGEVRQGFKRVEGALAEAKSKQQEMWNHHSNRLPPWVTILFTVMGSIITGIVVWSITK